MCVFYVDSMCKHHCCRSFFLSLPGIKIAQKSFKLSFFCGCALKQSERVGLEQAGISIFKINLI